ncbi:hypothetical protein AMK29_20640 [Streptomyces sp. CB02261]|nr:hypothetical protein AMK29_20640 [Streptomyces sp. CB02261]
MEIADVVDHLVAAAGAAMPSTAVVDVGQLLDPYRAATGGPWWRPTGRSSPLRMPLTRREGWTWCSGPGRASG